MQNSKKSVFLYTIFVSMFIVSQLIFSLYLIALLAQIPIILNGYLFEYRNLLFFAIFPFAIIARFWFFSPYFLPTGDKAEWAAHNFLSYVAIFANLYSLGYWLGILQFSGVQDPTDIIREYMALVDEKYWQKTETGLTNKFVWPVIERQLDFLYFSIATQSTVGFGDISAKNFSARLLSLIQIFLSFYLVYGVLESKFKKD